MTGTELLAILGGMAALTVSLCVLVGIGVKLMLLPWLREHLVTPVKETAHQVTVNGHVSRDPTLLDKVDNLQRDITTAARMFDGHIERSSGEWNRLWAAIKQLDERTQPHD